jgi:hypothetical protein
MSRKNILIRYARRFEREHERAPFDLREVANWLIKSKLWQPHHDLATKKCVEELASALREEYFTAEDGSRVRLYHAVRRNRDGRQLTLWANIHDAPREHMETALQQRRMQILGDCRQLNSDMSFYNQQRPNEPPIQMSFDFGEDLAEEEALKNLAGAA